MQSLSPTSTEYVVSVNVPSSTRRPPLRSGRDSARRRDREGDRDAVDHAHVAAAFRCAAAGCVGSAPSSRSTRTTTESSSRSGRTAGFGSPANTRASRPATRSSAPVPGSWSSRPPAEPSRPTRTSRSEVLTSSIRRSARTASGNLVVVYGESGDVGAAGSRRRRSRSADGTFTHPVVIAQSASRLRRRPLRRLLRRRARPLESRRRLGGGRGTAPTSQAETAGPQALRRLRSPQQVPRSAGDRGQAAPRARRARNGTAGKAVQLSVPARSTTGAAVRSVVTVQSKGKLVFTATSPKASLHAGKLYSVLWRPGEEAARHARRIACTPCSPSGAPSTRELLDRHASLRSARSSRRHTPGRSARRRGGSRRTRAPAARGSCAANVFVRRLAPPEIPKRRRMVEVVDANRAGGREPLLDSRPRRMLEVEREPERGVERSEQQLEDAFVACVLQRHAHRPEPVAERMRALSELVEAAQPVTRELRRELEPVRHLLRPAPELVLRRQPVARRVQLDRREPRRRRRRGTPTDRVPAG